MFFLLKSIIHLIIQLIHKEVLRVLSVLRLCRDKDNSKLPLVINKCILSALQWTDVIQRSFLPCTPCSWDRLQIHSYLDLDATGTANEWKSVDVFVSSRGKPHWELHHFFHGALNTFATLPRSFGDGNSMWVTNTTKHLYCIHTLFMHDTHRKMACIVNI